MIKLSSCCLLRAHQGLLVGGAGRDLRVRDPPVLHAEGEGAVGDHWDWGGQEGHQVTAVRGDEDEDSGGQSGQHLGPAVTELLTRPVICHV